MPAVDSGDTEATIFIGHDMYVADVQGLKSDKQFVSALEDNIRKRGAMDKLISDRGMVGIAERTQQILHALCIGDWQSEPHQQHQNFAKRRYNNIKANAN